ncbi:fimbrial protein FimG [Klebsiella pneumoniae subsp. rhinoscleromatis]|nr:fimbrial protein FimG [Klebsiella pneumoniae subsp. rhinoscleromatis]
MDSCGLAAGRPVNRERFPAGGRRHSHRQRQGGGQTLHGFHRPMPPSSWAISIPLACSGAGSASAWHSVALDLSNCPVGTSRVKATFSGTADSTGYYKNQGTAGNIQLELQNEDGTTLNNGSSQSVQVDEASQSARFPLQVRALSVNGGATQGTIQAVINVTYTYA